MCVCVYICRLFFVMFLNFYLHYAIFVYTYLFQTLLLINKCLLLIPYCKIHDKDNLIKLNTQSLMSLNADKL